jgi:hypothetical protein
MKKAAGWILFAFFVVALSFAGAPGNQQPLIRPDLVVTGIDFQKVQSGTDAQGKAYWIFNVTAKIKNQGNGNAGAFKVLIERNNGAGGAWQTACQTCTIDVGGLAAGQEMTTDPRQFNNAMGMASKFRFTADSGKQVAESNELNNSREETFFQMTVSEGGGTIPSELKCDLAIVRFEFRDVSTSVVGGKSFITLRVAVTVRNNGPGSAGACQAEFLSGYVADIVVAPFGPMKPVPALGSGQVTLVLSDPMTHDADKTRYFRVCLQTGLDIHQTNGGNDCSGVMQYPPKTTGEIPPHDLR